MKALLLALALTLAVSNVSANSYKDRITAAAMDYVHAHGTMVASKAAGNLRLNCLAGFDALRALDKVAKISTEYFNSSDIPGSELGVILQGIMDTNKKFDDLYEKLDHCVG